MAVHGSCCTSDCKFAQGTECVEGDCCDMNTCKAKTSSDECALTGGSTGFCGPGNTCQKSLCDRYMIDACVAADATRTCQAHCSSDGGGSCSPLSSWTSGGGPIPDALAAGTPCTKDSSQGQCDGSGTCVLASASSTCGDGNVDVGEECDDTSTCCNQCKLVGECSGGPCCDSQCRFKDAATTCPNPDSTIAARRLQHSTTLGYCVMGECRTTSTLCERSYSGFNLFLDASACPIPSGRDTGCQQHCATSGEGWDGCFHAGNDAGDPPNLALYLPQGTPCQSGGGVAGRCQFDDGSKKILCEPYRPPCSGTEPAPAPSPDSEATPAPSPDSGSEVNPVNLRGLHLTSPGRIIMGPLGEGARSPPPPRARPKD